MSKENSGK